MDTPLSLTRDSLFRHLRLWALALASIPLAAACSHDSRPAATTPPPAGGVTVRTIYASDCKHKMAGAMKADSVDCLEWEYDGAGTLLLRHLNTAFNCHPDSIYSVVVVQTGTIAVEEREYVPSPADCLCLYDLHTRITGLTGGTYLLHVSQDGVYPAEEHRITLDLSGPASGRNCLPRNRYPW